MSRPRWSAVELAEALGQPHRPTPEQVEVIEAPARPLLVVAGAGSGKTETMAARVVWLVANGLVEPDEVLGLTFTRKAASELSERVSTRLARLQQAGLWTPRVEEGAEVLGGAPTVSTYHAYAGRLVREHGLRLGYERESRLLSEAAAWQFAHEAVLAYDGPMDEVQKAPSTITAAVVDLAGELAEHLRGVSEVRSRLDEVVAALDAVPKGASSRLRAYPAGARDAVAALRERRAVLPIVEAFQDLKRRRDAVDFADQMALAARLAVTFDDVGRIERERFRAVLLDEFQDTSEAQLVFLRALFARRGEPVNVTAVGDPHQSIYGWRGASASTLDRFRDGFADPEPIRVLPLSTSWRNDARILQAANVTSELLARTARVPVRALDARPGAGPGRVAHARLGTVEEEAAYVVDWVADQRRRSEVRTSAILCRKRSQFDPLVAALEERGIAHEVVGLGGLLLTPEVADLVALLWVVQDPSRGDQLMRLLTGPTCRLGAADLDGLAAWSRSLQHQRAGDDQGAGGGVDLAPDSADRPSLVEALEHLPPIGWSGAEGQRLGSVARERLTGLATVVRRLRGLTGLPLADLAMEAEHALGLDIEVVARPGYTPAAARAHLDAFADVAAQFSVSAERPTLGGLLDWLAAALESERGLDLGWIETSPDAVQVMTVHAAKGLEWDVVAVPGLVEATFPAHAAATSSVRDGEWGHPAPTDKGWLGGLAGLPFELRGDADALARFDWRGPSCWQDLRAELERFVEACAEHSLREERRLAYVAVTRARRALLLTAAVWGSAKTPRITSRFLTELRDHPGLDLVKGPWADLPDPAAPAANPRTAQDASMTWPVAPGGPHRDAFVSAARRVSEAITPGPGAVKAGGEASAAGETSRGPWEEGPWEKEMVLLLAERERLARTAAEVVELPGHLSTSQLVALAADPERFTSALRRPMPAPPAPATRRGTAFHAWLEQHYSRAAMVDVLELPGSADEHPGGDAELPAMQARFLASEWAERSPVEVETALETVLDGIAVRGRADAVFRDWAPGSQGGWVVVDWKSGPPPGASEARVRAVQLAVYRLAWARLRGADLSSVRAAFYYAATGETRWPDLPTVAELSELLRRVAPG